MKNLVSIVVSIIIGMMFVGQSWAGPEPYAVGIALDLTGRAATLGIPEKRGYEMTVDKINQAGGINGRQIKLVVLDNESKPAKAVLNTKKLIGVENVIAILGYSTSGSILASAQTAEESETMVVANAASEKIWKPTKKWIFNVVPSQAYACTPILMENLF